MSERQALCLDDQAYAPGFSEEIWDGDARLRRVWTTVRWREVAFEFQLPQTLECQVGRLDVTSLPTVDRDERHTEAGSELGLGQSELAPQVLDSF
jgi:hypothetical protein